jgi:hypothetical protein
LNAVHVFTSMASKHGRVFSSDVDLT